MTAFLVSTYHLPDQAERLVRRLSAVPGATVLVHHDRAAPVASAAALTASVAELPNVEMLPSRVCRYATFDHVQVTLDGIARLVARDAAFGHLVLLTGQCYPLMASEELAAWFDERTGRSVMEILPLPHPTWPDGGYNRVDAWLLPVAVERVPRKMRRLLPKRANWVAVPKPSLLRYRLGGKLAVHVPAAVGELHGGLGYWAMAEAHARYVHANQDPFVRFFRAGYIPDELFFQTVLANSPHLHEVDRERMHAVDFHRQGGMNPYVWRSDDLEVLVSSDRPFARKFDVRVDAGVLDAIDHHLAERSGDPTTPSGC
jgi:hypothetical protein